PSAKGDDKFITTDYLQQCLLAWENFRFPSGPLKRTPYSTIIFDIQTDPNYISSLWQQRPYISIAAVATIFWLFTKTI
ncbi:hypothetical protein OE223_23395, partial [Escherichia coli]